MLVILGALAKDDLEIQDPGLSLQATEREHVPAPQGVPPFEAQQRVVKVRTIRRL